MISVLINAYACRPDSGSEPGMGWNWVMALAGYCKLHVITEGEWMDEIELALQGHPYRENVRFYYLPVSEKVRSMCWNQGNWLFYLHYAAWQKRALSLARSIIVANNIDIIHQLNMIGYREPGYLWKIDNIPFVWGPVGGMENMPLAYAKGAEFNKKFFVVLKNILNSIQLRFQPRVRKAFNRADVIIASGHGVETKIREVFGKSALIINETGCFAVADVNGKSGDEVLFNIIWVGKFDFRKQLILALKTLERLKHLKGIRLHIVGDGNPVDVEGFKSFSSVAGIDDICIWHGAVSNSSVQDMMRNSDLLFFTSIMEATSTVVTEAISNGLPVVCFDTCGFGPLIDNSVGFKITLTNPDLSVLDFAERIEYLYNNRDVLKSMSRNCIEKAKGELSWNNKVKMVLDVYNKINLV